MQQGFSNDLKESNHDFRLKDEVINGPFGGPVSSHFNQLTERSSSIMNKDEVKDKSNLPLNDEDSLLLQGFPPLHSYTNQDNTPREDSNKLPFNQHVNVSFSSPFLKMSV